jgi:hypothetical protein
VRYAYIYPNEVTFQNNVMGTYNILEAAAGLGIQKAVIASSECTYGICNSRQGLAPAYVPVDEDHPTSQGTSVWPNRCLTSFCHTFMQQKPLRKQALAERYTIQSSNGNILNATYWMDGLKSAITEPNVVTVFLTLTKLFFYRVGKLKYNLLNWENFFSRLKIPRNIYYCAIDNDLIIPSVMHLAIFGIFW